MKTASVLAFVAWSLFATPVSAGELESLAPETALAEIQKTSGVVFVDLYADW